MTKTAAKAIAKFGKRKSHPSERMELLLRTTDENDKCLAVPIKEFMRAAGFEGRIKVTCQPFPWFYWIHADDGNLWLKEFRETQNDFYAFIAGVRAGLRLAKKGRAQ